MSALHNMLFDNDVIKDQIQFNEQEYTTTTMIPHYAPSKQKPALTDFIDLSKYNQLMEEIEKSGVSEQDKYMLRLAATRHIVFTYDKVADYYANSSKEVQELMEHSALVLIDLDDAIAQGYAVLSKQIDDIRQRDRVIKEEKDRLKAEEREKKANGK